jgi:hypothetical protein
MGFFNDGDLPSLPQADQKLLRAAPDGVSDIPGAQAAEWIAAGQPKVTLFGACLPKARCVFERLFRKPNSVKRDRFR